MKKMLSILIVIIFLLITVSYIYKEQIQLSINYTKQTGECIVTNNTSNDYEEVIIHFDAYDGNGNKTEFIKNIDKFYQGDVLTFNLAELTETPEEIEVLKLVDFEYLTTQNVDMLGYFTILVVILAISLICLRWSM